MNWLHDEHFVVIIAAIIAAIPAAIAAWAAVKGRKQTQTRNGKTAGHMLDDLKDDVALIKLWVAEHLRDHENEGK